MPENVVIHVGPHKTGTTALQKAFAINADRLGRYGICYPGSGRAGAAHQNIAKACREKNTRLLGDLAEEVSDQRKVLLSSELFSALDKRSLQLLADTLSGAEFQIVYVLRRLPALWVSHWKEQLKHGKSMSFHEYLGFIGDPDVGHYVTPPQPVLQLDNLKNVFGRDALRLFIYDARRVETQDYGPDFVDELFGIGQDANYFKTSVLNQTAPDWQIELQRQLNILAGDQMDYPRKWKLRSLLIKEIEESPPAWIAEFKKTFEMAPKVTISELSPAVAAEQNETMRKYRAQIADPLDAYCAPIEISVHHLDPTTLPRNLRGEIHLLFERLSAQV